MGLARGGHVSPQAERSRPLTVGNGRVENTTSTGTSKNSAIRSARCLAARGYRTAVAAMTLPNDASAALHRALGFAEVGTLRRVGWKDGAWRDVLWVQRELGGVGDGPPGGEPG